MKKLMFAIGAVALCGAVFAEEAATQEVGSQIVGFKTFTLKEDYTLCGVCFKSCDGSALEINKAIPYKEGNGMTKAFDLADADKIQVMTDEGYVTYFLSNGQYGKGGKNYDAKFDGKWLKIAGQECHDTVTSGQAFWYVSKMAATTSHQITLAGEVIMDAASPEKTCAEEYTLLANPFAIDVPLNGGVVATGTTKAFDLADADKIQVMTDEGYVTYFLSNGQYGKGGKNYDEKFDNKWLKIAGQECTDPIPAGASFWYISKSKASTVKLINPLAK